MRARRPYSLFVETFTPISYLTTGSYTARLRACQEFFRAGTGLLAVDLRTRFAAKREVREQAIVLQSDDDRIADGELHLAGLPLRAGDNDREPVEVAFVDGRQAGLRGVGSPHRRPEHQPDDETLGWADVGDVVHDARAEEV